MNRNSMAVSTVCVKMCSGAAVVSLRPALSLGAALSRQLKVRVQDAATLFSMVRWLRVMCHQLRQTTLVSLLQPPPETYALFDDVMLMTEGTVVYHGPVQGAVAYIAEKGFDLPLRKVRFLVRSRLLHRCLLLRPRARCLLRACVWYCP